MAVEKSLFVAEIMPVCKPARSNAPTMLAGWCLLNMERAQIIHALSAYSEADDCIEQALTTQNTLSAIPNCHSIKQGLLCGQLA